MPYVGKLGGFFDALGWTGVGSTILGVIIWVFLQGYISGVIAKRIAENPEEPTQDEYVKAELYTTIPLAGVPLVFGFYRNARPEVSDTMDAVGCVMGGGLLYEAANLVEIGAAKLGLLA